MPSRGWRRPTCHLGARVGDVLKITGAGRRRAPNSDEGRESVFYIDANALTNRGAVLH
jgi:hypothetical protein